MLTNLRKKSEEGFTLIELMIVIAIIGILAAIAIPQFSAYRQRSYNSAAQADLRNATTAQEAYFVDHGRYAGDIGDLLGATYGLFTSARVDMRIEAADTFGYEMVSWHTSVPNTSWEIVGPGGSIAER